MTCLCFPLHIQKLKNTATGCEEELTCHCKLSKGHPLQECAEQLAGSIFEAEEQRNGLSVVQLRQTSMLLPQVFIAHLIHTDSPPLRMHSLTVMQIKGANLNTESLQ